MINGLVISIGGRDVRVETVDRLEGCIGRTKYEESRIQVQKGLDNRTTLETLIHELLHNFHSVNGWQDYLGSKREEQLTTVMATQWTELFVRNPEFVKACQKLAR